MIPARHHPASFHYATFGAQWRSDLPLPHFDAVEGVTADARGAGAIMVRTVATLAARTPLRTVNGGFAAADGFRFAWRDEAVFDVHHPVDLQASGTGIATRIATRIDCVPGPRWSGAMPAAFYSTVAALTLALRGGLPCHASAVEVAGKAILIAGVAGAGKSTLTAALLTRGARLIADDLTVVEGPSPDGVFVARRGRPGIRLHADTAAQLPAIDRQPIPDDDRGKWLVRPEARTGLDHVPLAGVILLDGSGGAIDRRDRAILLGPHLFRPRWLAALPGHAARLRMMLTIADRVPCRGLDCGAGFHRDTAAVERAMGLIAALLDT